MNEIMNDIELLTDQQANEMEMLMAKFKARKEVRHDRIHLRSDGDFGDYALNFHKVLQRRSIYDGNSAQFLQNAISLIDTGYCGAGKRGMLVSRIGIFLLGGLHGYQPNDAIGFSGLISWKKFLSSKGNDAIDFDTPGVSPCIKEELFLLLDGMKGILMGDGAKLPEEVNEDDKAMYEW